MVSARTDQIVEDIVTTIRSPLLVLDSDLTVILANQNFYELFMVTPEETIGNSIYGLGNGQWDIPKLREMLESILHEETSFNDYEIEHDFATIGRKIMLFNTRQIEPAMGKERTVLLSIEDITKRKQKDATDSSRLHILKFSATHSLAEILEETLNEAEKLTGSLISFYHFVEKNQKFLTLQNWSTRTKTEFCKARGKGSHYSIAEAGVWVDCLYQRKGVIHNDYASLPHRKGMPEGHPEVIRQLAVPIIRAEKIVAILGVGNKPSGYSQNDLETVTRLADLAWEIAELKKMEEDLLNAKKRLDSLVINSPVVIYCSKASGDFGATFISENVVLQLGYEAREFMQESNFWERRIHPNDKNHVFDELSHLFEKGHHIHEYRFLHKDGSYMWMRDELRLVKDAQGNPTEIVGFWIDITERRQAEEALHESEERLRRVVENMPVLMNALDEDANIISWNRESERVTGYKAEEVIGNPHAIEILYPDEVYRKQMISELNNLGFDFRDKEYTLTCKDGTKKTISWSNISSKYPVPGWHTWAIGVDVTEHKRIETNLKSALEETRLSKKEKSALLKVSQMIPLSRTFAEAARMIFDTCKKFIGASSGYVALLSEDGEENEVLFLEAGGLPCNVDPDLPMPIRGLREVAYRTKEVVYDNQFAKSQWQKYMPPGHVQLDNVLFAPLNIKGQAVGLIGIANKLGGFTEEDANIAKSFSDLASVALTYAQYQGELRESEEKYRSMMEAMRDPAYICSPNYYIEYMNPAMINRIGYDATGEFCFNALHNMEKKCKWCMHDRIYEGKTFEQEIKSPKDNNFYHVAHSPIVHLDGSISKMAVYRDITDIKSAEERIVQSEKRFRDLFESITDLIYTQDLEGRFTSANPAMVKLLGYDMDEFIGHKAADFMEPELRPHFDSEYLEKLKNQGHYEGVTKYFKKDDSKIYIEYRGILVKPDDGDPYVSGIGRDVTEKVLYEREVAKLQKRLSQAQKMESLGTLAGGIAHDFNNILFPVIGYTEMMIEDLPEESPIQESLKGILAGGKRAKDLVKQILAFSRQSDQEIRPLRVQLVIKEVLKLIRSTLPSTIGISQYIRNDCRMVMADYTQIHQIAMNLVTNAYHAMEDTGGTLKVNLEEVELEDEEIKELDMIPGPYVCLTVADTGMGMPQDVMDRIFDPYFTTKADGKGTGLGLAVAHGIVKSHGGHISVDSTSGVGTGFKVFLPVIQTEAVTKEIEKNLPIQGGTERVLLVDDEREIVTMERLILERMGYQVTVRTSSVEALEVFKSDPEAFDLVITDLTMPNMIGTQLAKEIMTIRPNMPVILCTGFSEKISEEKASKIGFKGFLLKPIVKSDLSEKIRKVLDKDDKGDTNG